jgi:ABC-type amino acid transport substrate-binding protein
MVCFATVAALGATLTLAAAGDEVLTIGTEAPFPPYVVLEASGELSGFDHQLMQEICSRERLTCDWQLATFGELIPGVMNGRFDVALGGMAITPERREQVDFSDPYMYSGDTEWFMGSPGAPPPDQAQIAVQKGTLHESYLRAQGLTYRAFPTESATLQALTQGQADLAFGPFSARPDLDPLFDATGITPLYDVVLGDEGTAIAVCKGNEDLLALLNASIAAMVADGTLAALESRWF